MFLLKTIIFKTMIKHYNEFTTKDLRKHSEFYSQVSIYQKKEKKLPT